MNLKNINRGLVLGAVVAIGAAIYIRIDDSNFENKSKGQVKEVAQTFVEDLAQSNVGDIKAAQAQGKKVIEDYFTDYKNSYDYTYKKSDFMSEFSDKTYDPATNDGVVTKVATNIESISVSKCGTDGAKASVEYNTYVEFTGNEFPFLGMFGTEFLYTGDSEDDSGDKKKTGHYSASSSSTADIYLKKVDGEWKIASTDTSEMNMLSENIQSLDEDSSSEEKETKEKKENTDSKADETSAGETSAKEDK